MKEIEGLESSLWMEKAPPIVMSPSFDNSGNSGLPIISQSAVSSLASKAPKKSANSNIT